MNEDRQNKRGDDPVSADGRTADLAREALAEVDPAVVARLAAMRREAVELAATQARPTWLERLFTPVPLAAAAAALGLVLAVWLSLRTTDGALPLPLLTEPEIAVVQELELLEELEFLAWLEEAETDGAG